MIRYRLRKAPTGMKLIIWIGIFLAFYGVLTALAWGLFALLRLVGAA